jgi:hypothetical protein
MGHTLIMRFSNELNFCPLNMKSLIIRISYSTIRNFAGKTILPVILLVNTFGQTGAQELDIAGSVRIMDGTQGEGRILTSDADGLASWKSPAIYKVGDFAQGGVVFWVDETGQHGLVCASSDQSAGIRWYAGTSGNTQAKGDGIYAGEMNTAIIIASQVAIGDDGSTYAARLCVELQITEGNETFGDWYLPSKAELNLMYQNKSVIDASAVANGGSNFSSGNFSTSFYWSSTELDGSTVWFQNFTVDNQSGNFKDGLARVRAIRAF